MLKKICISFALICISSPVWAGNNIWINDLKNLFLSNNAIIYEVNLRTFAANDTDGNGIIDFEKGETSGNFLNAIGRLDELKDNGINTIHVLPIMELGKTKALGTAGSLYAPLSFDKLNPQLKNKQSSLSLENQAITFINEAHKRSIRVIVDLPSCGSYDLYLKNPELFLKDASGQSIIPRDWTDVRLFDAGDENNINQKVYELYKNFVDYVIMLGADGIRADVATLKPAKFWKTLIDYSHTRDPQFLWLAEASESWTEPICKECVFTPYDKLLDAGFDGFYGSWFKLKDWRSANELTNYIKTIINLQNKYGKTTIGSFTTHDELSPVLINGIPYSSMILWLNTTLPINSYFVDGFPTGDNYIYFWSNKKAIRSYTDNKYYFTNRGKLDIFNFSKQPNGNRSAFNEEFARANFFKDKIANVITNGKLAILKTGNKEVFSYILTFDKVSVVVFGNMNFRSRNEAYVKVPNYNPTKTSTPIQLKSIPVFEKDKFHLKLEPAEVQVLLITD